MKRTGKNAIYLGILAILVIVDAMLLADTRPKENITLFVLNTQAVATLGSALLTVGGTIAICLLIAYLCRRFLSPTPALVSLLILFGFSAFTTLRMYVATTYADREEMLTGDFIAGATLLGVLMMIVFGKEAYDVTKLRHPKLDPERR